jgi:hypothetical protein
MCGVEVGSCNLQWIHRNDFNQFPIIELVFVIVE